MHCYRIYTENRNEDEIVEETSNMFKNFTIYHGLGYYKGQGEDCLVLEIIAPAVDYLLVKALARSIKLLNSQDSVLITDNLIVVESV